MPCYEMYCIVMYGYITKTSLHRVDLKVGGTRDRNSKIFKGKRQNISGNLLPSKRFMFITDLHFILFYLHFKLTQTKIQMFNQSFFHIKVLKSFLVRTKHSIT